MNNAPENEFHAMSMTEIMEMQAENRCLRAIIERCICKDVIDLPISTKRDLTKLKEING